MSMMHWRPMVLPWVIVLAIGVSAGTEARAQSSARWRVPLVMERATVRGKVVVLETRAEERSALKGLPVELWSSKPGSRGRRDRDERLHTTRTDSDGFFSLPVVDVGEYLFVVGQLQLRLAVIPEAEVRVGQEQEPKVLLILLPKEVL